MLFHVFDSFRLDKRYSAEIIVYSLGAFVCGIVLMQIPGLITKSVTNVPSFLYLDLVFSYLIMIFVYFNTEKQIFITTLLLLILKFGGFYIYYYSIHGVSWSTIKPPIELAPILLPAIILGIKQSPYYSVKAIVYRDLRNYQNRLKSGQANFEILSSIEENLSSKKNQLEKEVLAIKEAPKTDLYQIQQLEKKLNETIQELEQVKEKNQNQKEKNELLKQDIDASQDLLIELEDELRTKKEKRDIIRINGKLSTKDKRYLEIIETFLTQSFQLQNYDVTIRKSMYRDMLDYQRSNPNEISRLVRGIIDFQTTSKEKLKATREDDIYELRTSNGKHASRVIYSKKGKQIELIHLGDHDFVQRWLSEN